VRDCSRMDSWMAALSCLVARLHREGGRAWWPQSVSADEGEEFAAQRRVLQERTTHDAVHHLGLVVFDATPVHAEVVCFHHHRQPVGLTLFMSKSAIWAIASS